MSQILLPGHFPKLQLLQMEKMELSDQTHAMLTLAGVVSSTIAKDTNMVISPLSLHIILTIIAAGSGGATRDQVMRSLRSKSSEKLNEFWSELTQVVLNNGESNGGPKLSFVNGMWVHQSFTLKASFDRLVKDTYKAACQQVDFLNEPEEVISQVNAWAEEHTSGLIKDLIPAGSVDSRDKLIFANALYFKGTWSQEFDVSDTTEGDFYLLDGSSIKVPFMTTREEQFIRGCDGFKVLGLPYKKGGDNRELFMYVILPDSKNGLPALMEKVRSQPGFLNEHLPFRGVDVHNFKLPKFKISFEFEASNVLKSLGVTLPFSTGGLTEITDSSEAQKLYVSNIFHKAYVEVNEEGTVAAAASAFKIRLLCYRPPVDFVADHPFMFLIRENVAGAVLFIGHVMNPLNS